jgi:hypothetical protein
MGRLIIAFALLGATGLIVSALADEQQPQTQQQEQAGPRDGRWLREGIRDYQRVTDKVANQLEESQGLRTASYIMGVLDEIRSTVIKAQLQEAVINASKKTADPTSKVDPRLLEEMENDGHYFAPLWNTDFLKSHFQLAQYAQIISKYLDAHPEKWDKEANELLRLA